MSYLCAGIIIVSSIGAGKVNINCLCFVHADFQTSFYDIMHLLRYLSIIPRSPEPNQPKLTCACHHHNPFFFVYCIKYIIYSVSRYFISSPIHIIEISCFRNGTFSSSDHSLHFIKPTLQAGLGENAI